MRANRLAKLNRILRAPIVANAFLNVTILKWIEQCLSFISLRIRFNLQLANFNKHCCSSNGKAAKFCSHCTTSDRLQSWITHATFLSLPELCKLTGCCTSHVRSLRFEPERCRSRFYAAERTVRFGKTCRASTRRNLLVKISLKFSRLNKCTCWRQVDVVGHFSKSTKIQPRIVPFLTQGQLNLVLNFNL